MSEVVSQFSISIEQVQGYEFKVRFDKEHYAELRMDEPAPLGRDSAPNPARILAAAMGNCLCASLLFCLRKARVNVEHIQAEVKVEVVRTEQRRLRIGRVEVTLDPRLDPAEREKAQNCLAIFEDFCVVTQSVRQGVPVQVTVKAGAD